VYNRTQAEAEVRKYTLLSD